MLEISVGSPDVAAKVVVLPVSDSETEGVRAQLPGALADEVGLFLAGLDHAGTAGTVNALPGPDGTRGTCCCSASVTVPRATGARPVPAWSEPRPSTRR